MTASSPATAPGPATPAGRTGVPSRLSTVRRRWRRLRASLADLLAGSPGSLRRAALTGAAGALLTAVAGGLALQAQAAATGTARDASAHLDLVQGVRTAVVHADADATNAFLRGGLEPVPQRREYLASMASATRDLAVAARTGSGDGSAYARASEGLSRYAGMVETARAENRHQLPIGASYLRMASRQLRGDVLPELSRLAAEDSDRVASAYTAARVRALLFAGSALLGSGLLIAAQVRLARITRAVFTVPAVITGLLFGVSVVAAGALSASSVLAADGIHSGDSARTGALAQARAAAFDARATESLVLIARGSLAEDEQQWQASFRTARAQAGSVDGSLLPALDAYAAEHTALHTLDTTGKWPDAVGRALATTPGSAAADLASFDTASSGLLARSRAATLDGLAAARDPLPPSSWAVAVAGLVAVVGMVAGVARRLGEYR